MLCIHSVGFSLPISSSIRTSTVDKYSIFFSMPSSSLVNIAFFNSARRSAEETNTILTPLSSISFAIMQANIVLPIPAFPTRQNPLDSESELISSGHTVRYFLMPSSMFLLAGFTLYPSMVYLSCWLLSPDDFSFLDAAFDPLHVQSEYIMYPLGSSTTAIISLSC